MEMTSKMKRTSKIVPPPKKNPPITIPPDFFFLMTSSHTKIDVKPQILSVVQTGNRIPHDEYDIRHIAFDVHKEMPTFLYKDD